MKTIEELIIEYLKDTDQLWEIEIKEGTSIGYVHWSTHYGEPCIKYNGAYNLYGEPSMITLTELMIWLYNRKG